MTVTVKTDFGTGGSGVTPGGSSGSPSLAEVLRSLVTDVTAVAGGSTATTEATGTATTEATGTTVTELAGSTVTGTADGTYGAEEAQMINDLIAAVNLNSALAAALKVAENQNIALLAELKAQGDQNVLLLAELKAALDATAGVSLGTVNG